MTAATITKPAPKVATPAPTPKAATPEPFVIEAFNGAYVRIEANEEFNDKGVKLVAISYNLPIELISFSYTYQRAIEEPKTKGLIKSFGENGRWPWLTVTINPDRNPIDGNHRTFVSIALGYTTIPIVHEMDFTSPEAEVEFFLEMNKMPTQIKADHYVWRAKFLAKQIAGELFYKLVDQDESSQLFDKVSIVERKPLRSRIPISAAWELIAKCGLGYSRGWRIDEEGIYNARIEEVGYENIKESVNEFMIFFINCHRLKEAGCICWGSKPFKVFIDLFILLKKNDLLSTAGKYNRAVNHISKFNIDKNIVGMEYGSLLALLIDKYNRKKKAHNRIVNTKVFER